MRGASGPLLGIRDRDDFPTVSASEQLKIVCSAMVDRIADPQIVFDPDRRQIVLDSDLRIPEGLFDGLFSCSGHHPDKLLHPKCLHPWISVRVIERKHKSSTAIYLGIHFG